MLFNGGGTVKDLRGGDLQVDLQFSDRSMRKLNAVVWYLNGRREKVRLSHGKKVDTQGRFVFELNAEEAWRDFTFLSLDVTVESDAKPTSVEATLCVRPDRETVWSANEQFAHTHNTL
ncbi:MAG: alginate biosynthesis protein AlgX [Gammaproteobacteria bacterium]